MPVTLADDLAYAVSLPTPPRRVVSLVPSITEALATTCPERLVGATDWCTHPEGLAVQRVRGTKNPDLDPNFTFPQAIPSLHSGKHTAIPRSNNDLNDPNFLQAIANTAAFHFPTIEQGGNSLYPAMAQRATSVEVLRILISIGPTETMHFQT